jgi:O-Antigen ligase
MFRIAVNTIKPKSSGFRKPATGSVFTTEVPVVLPKNAKMLAWGIFLIYFIENGTLGLIPRNFYFVFRNVRLSDILIYALTVYSIYSSKDFLELYRSKSVFILKLMLVYLLGQFIVSCILYNYNILEYFFRLKGIWLSFLVFPFLLLMKRKALPYLVKIILPVAIVSNILYILSALTGIAFLPEIGIAKQDLPGGLQVYRVFGGTFFGELFFLGFIYQWITDKFRLYQLPLVILFIIPHILAFGRSAWMYFTFTIIIMFVWYSLKKRDFRIAMRQVVLLVVLGVTLIYAFIQFIPRSEYFTEAIQARIGQGADDVKYNEGTYRTRLNSVDALLELWMNNNILFGIGMHPLWVVKPVTEEENLYAWGFSDVNWAAILAAYGLVGFLLALYFQGYYAVQSFKIIKKTKKNDLYTFLVIIFFARLLFDSIINYSTNFFTANLYGFESSVLYLAALVCKYEHIDE